MEESGKSLVELFDFESGTLIDYEDELPIMQAIKEID